MAEQKNFKERVKDTLIQCAGLYKRYYVDYEYLICSSAFSKYSYYIISAHEDNFLHLTGIHTNLDAKTFFDKCYKGTLQETDFNFSKKGQNESEVKGSVRRKINSLLMITPDQALNCIKETTDIDEIMKILNERERLSNFTIVESNQEIEGVPLL